MSKSERLNGSLSEQHLNHKELLDKARLTCSRNVWQALFLFKLVVPQSINPSSVFITQ